MPGTPSGVNHSSDSQKCGRKTMPRSASSASRSPMRFCSALPSIERSSSDIRRSRSLSSLHLAQNGVLRRGRDGASCGASAGGAEAGAGGSSGSGTASFTIPEWPETAKMPTCRRRNSARMCSTRGTYIDEGPSPLLGGRDPAVRGGGLGADRAAGAAVHHRSVSDDHRDFRGVVLCGRDPHPVLVEPERHLERLHHPGRRRRLDGSDQVGHRLDVCGVVLPERRSHPPHARPGRQRAQSSLRALS